jgi:hypothetical protein
MPFPAELRRSRQDRPRDSKFDLYGEIAFGAGEGGVEASGGPCSISLARATEWHACSVASLPTSVNALEGPALDAPSRCSRSNAKYDVLALLTPGQADKF